MFITISYIYNKFIYFYNKIIDEYEDLIFVMCNHAVVARMSVFSHPGYNFIEQLFASCLFHIRVDN